MPPTIIDLTQASPPALAKPAKPAIPPRPMISPLAGLLSQTIALAESSRVRSTLVAVCNASPEAAQITGSLLLVDKDSVLADDSSAEEEDEEDEEDVGGESDGNDEGTSNNGADQRRNEASDFVGLTSNDLKRMRSRYAVCETCKEEFDVLDNRSGSCRWHDGENAKDFTLSDTSASLHLVNSQLGDPERNYEYWTNHYEPEDGEIDTDEMREKHPEGFIYGCCEEDGDSRGCQKGRHVEPDIEPDIQSKRRQYSPPMYR